MRENFSAAGLAAALGACDGRTEVLGTSRFGRPILCRLAGKTGPRVLVVAGHHAREHLASRALLAALRRSPPPRCRLAVIPFLNPDGVLLCLKGLPSVPPSFRAHVRSVNGGSEDFSLWKANGVGVDLNVNFPAKWGMGAGNRRQPAPQGYVGPYSLSEPENLALVRFLQRFRPDILLTLHTKGEVLYWHFGQRGAALVRDRRIAGILAARLGLALAEAPHSTGGLKDFAVQFLGIPAFTCELGPDSLPHPLPDALLAPLSQRLAGIWDLAAEAVAQNPIRRRP